MKYLNVVTITLWCIFAIANFGDIKPSDNYYLYVLSVCSILISIVNILELIIKRR